MTVRHLLTQIAKYVDDPPKHLKEAQQGYKVYLSDGAGDGPVGTSAPREFAARVLQDCDGNLIDCDHQESDRSRTSDCMM